MGGRKTIKSLEISDFRGLHGSRKLDFEGADIVLLLGLNGFGKTSVFDAIEWCLTGKLGRYEQYNEIGRKQDFGKEKEVLRNKYATNPNTFAKVILEDNTTFGRRVVVSGNESDYNMGSIIDGCNYGLESITKELIRPELANSYFSATHILSQETINHFVTSKKPEERYQALSVNFGTAIFAPFENNLQMLVGKISENEKDIKQQIKSKSEFISTLNSQITSKAQDITSELDKANSIIGTLTEMGLNLSLNSLVVKNSLINIDASFEETVKSLRSRTSLGYAGTKDRIVGLRYLEENNGTWIKNNKELKNIETVIFKDREYLVELDNLNKTAKTISREITDLKERLKSVGVKRSNLQLVLKDLPHFIKVATKIAAIEKSIADRKMAVANAQINTENLEKNIFEKTQNIINLDEKIKDHQSTLAEIEKNNQFFVKYESEHKETLVKIANAQNKLESITNKSQQYHTILKTLESLSKPLSIRSLIDNPEYVEFFEQQILKELEKLLKNIENITGEIDKCKIEENQLHDKENQIRNRFSESRKLLSSALTLISQDSKEQHCPVCDTNHNTKSLVKHIEVKLGVEESETLKNIHERLRSVHSQKSEIQKDSEVQYSKFKDLLGLINTHLTNGLSGNISEEALAKKSIDSLIRQKSDMENKYEKLTLMIDRLLDSKSRDYSFIKKSIVKSIESITKNLEIEQSLKNDLQKQNAENDKLLRNVLRLNESELSEISSLKDTKYLGVHSYLQNNGLDTSLSEVDTGLKDLLSKVTKEESGISEDVKNKDVLLKRNKESIAEILQDKDEVSFRKSIVEKDEKISKLKQTLSEFLDHLSKMEISPADYSINHIQDLMKQSVQNLDRQERQYEELDKLLKYLEEFKNFNADNASREKVGKLESQVKQLKIQEKAAKIVKTKVNKLNKSFPSALKGLIKENLDVNLFNQIYGLLNPHRRFKIIDFNVDVNRNKIGINFNAKHSKIEARPEFLFSSAQLNTFGICMFLSMALRQNWLDLDTIFIDDPIQNLDDINILSFIDFLRSLLDSKNTKKQIVLSTHDERFYDLMIRKFQDYKVKSFRYESYGRLSPDVLPQKTV